MDIKVEFKEGVSAAELYLVVFVVVKSTWSIWGMVEVFTLQLCHMNIMASQITGANTVNHWWPGGRLNKKDGLTRYGNSHVKDKTS